MKRKRPPSVELATSDTVVPEAILDQAVFDDPIKKTTKCVVCAEETPEGASEGLCWVCRRLKFSAWRDSDTQMPAQE